jgi:hypothetical protein
VLGVGFPIFALENENNAATGGIVVQHRGVPATCVAREGGSLRPRSPRPLASVTPPRTPTPPSHPPRPDPSLPSLTTSPRPLAPLATSLTGWATRGRASSTRRWAATRRATSRSTSRARPA